MELEAVFVVLAVSVLSSIVLAFMWFTMRQPTYDEVVANQSHKLKFLDSLGSGKKKEKVEKKGKKEKKQKPSGKKKDASEDEETSNQTDELPELVEEPDGKINKTKSRDSREFLVSNDNAHHGAPLSNEKPVKSVPSESKQIQKKVSESENKDANKIDGKIVDKDSKKAKINEKKESAKAADKPLSMINGKDAVSPKENKLPKEHIDEKLPKEHKDEKLPRELKEEKLLKEHKEEKLPKEYVKEEKVVKTNSKLKSAVQEEPEKLIVESSKKTGSEKKKKVDSLQGSDKVSSASQAMNSIGHEGAQWVQSVQNMGLSDGEKMILNNAGLLQNQPSPTNQKSKGDQIGKADDKENSIIAEKEHLKSVVAALKQEIVDEKKKSGDLEKQLSELEKHRAGEVQSLRIHLQQTLDQHSAEIKTLQHQLSDSVQALQRFRDENRQLKEASLSQVLVADEATKLQLKVQMEEMSKLTLNLNTAENAKQNLEKKVIRLEEQLQQAAREKLDIERSTRDRNDEIARIHAQYASVGKEMERLQFSLKKAQQDCEKLQHEKDAAWQQVELLKENEKKFQLLASERQTIGDQLHERNHELEEACKKYEANIQQLSEVNIKLNADFSGVRQRIIELEEQIAKSAQNSGNLQDAAATRDENVEKREQQLNEQIRQLSAEISKLQGEVELQKEKNKELRTRNGIALDALRSTEEIVRKLYREKDIYEEKLHSNEKKAKRHAPAKESELSSAHSNDVVKLKEEVNSITKAKSVAEAKLSDLENQLHLKADEINQLRGTINDLQKSVDNKESKAADANGKLAEVEAKLAAKLSEIKDLQSTISSLTQAQAESVDEQKHLRDRVNCLFPNVSVSDSSKHGEWLLSLVEELSKNVGGASHKEKESQVSELQSRVASLQNELSNVQSEFNLLQSRSSVVMQENNALLAQVDQYKTVLESTESILKKLQASVETEEQQWREKIQNAETVLMQIRNDNQSLQNEIGNLKEESNRSHMQLSEYKSKAEEVEILRGQLEKLRNDHQWVSGEKVGLINEVESLKGQLEKLRNDHQWVSGEKVGLSNELAASKETIRLLEERANSLEQQLHTLQTENAEKIKSLEHQLQNSQQAQEKLKEAEGQIKTLEAELHNVKEQLQSSNKKLENLQATHNGSPSSEEITELKKKLSEIEQNLAKEVENNKQLTLKLESHPQVAVDMSNGNQNAV